jgi:hypothetical protein
MYTVEITEYDPEVEAPEGISGEITVPGEEVKYTFQAEPGQVVYFDALEGSTDIIWDLIDADGNTVFNGQWTRENDDPGRYELALGGEYTLRFDGRRDVTGPFRFTMYDVPQTPAYAINVGDTVAPNQPQSGAGTIVVPGEIDTYTFSVRAGTTVDFQSLLGSTDIIWSVIDPNGTAVFSNQWTREGDGPGVHTLAAGGEYTITVSGRGATTGDYSFRIGRG